MSAPVLLYDPDCGLCTRTAGLLRHLRPDAAVRPQSPETLAALGVDAERALHEVPFVHPDGRVTWGAAAVADALRTCPAPVRWAGVALSTPAGLAVGRPVYRWVARNRHRLPGGTPTCGLGDTEA